MNPHPTSAHGSRSSRPSDDPVARHYEALLAERYAWMLGDFDRAIAEQRELLRSLGVVCPSSTAACRALDLGAGNGLQSLALAELGFRVVAVDSSERLLKELDARRQTHAITTVHGDLRTLSALPEVGAAATPGGYQAAVCMGDTLTHLSATDEVAHLFDDVARLLAPGARFVVSFRDYTQAREGTGRFIPVRSDDQRIMTCFLEYQNDHVLVHDIVHERTPAGWEMQVSAYPKLRLSTAWTTAALGRSGFTIVHRDAGPRFTTLVAVRS